MARGGEEATTTGVQPDVSSRPHLRHKPFGDNVPQKIDIKGRMVLSSAVRDAFDEGGRLMPFHSGQCLGLWPEHSFGMLDRRLHEKRQGELVGNNARRALFALSSAVMPDAQGRFVIPDHQRRAVGLETDMVVVGQGDRLELWRPEAWQPVRFDAQTLADLEHSTDPGPHPDEMW